MSDTMSLEMRVTAHDDASPIIRKIMGEVRRLQDTVRKSFASPAGKLDLGLDSIKSAAANQRTESDRTAVTVMRNLSRVSAFQARMRRQAARESDYARRADAAGQADAIRDLRDRMRLGSRMAAQKLREEKDVARETAETRRSEAAAQAEALRSLRERMSFASRMTRQRVSEERAAARDIAQAERERARETRDNARLDARRTRERERADRSREREHERDRSEFTGRARDAGHRVSDAYTRSTRMAAGVGAAGAFGTGALVKRSLGAETSVDDAEIATRQYGGLSKSQARDLRDKWAAPLSEQLGVETSKLLGAWVDATKLGIPASGAKDFAKLTTKTSEAWEVGFDKVKDTLGTVNSILTSDGSAFDINRLSSVSNTLQHLAAKQSTTPEKLIEFLSQGAGASQILGASQEAGLAFGSASTSLGNKAGESGRLYDYIASRIVEMPRLTKKKGDDGKYSKQLMQELGYGTAENMDRIRRSNPDAFLPDFMDRFSKIKDPKKQEEAVRWFSGREWMGEFGRMVKGAETYREAEKLRQEAKGLDAIGEVWETHKEKLSFVFKQFKAGWLNILGEFGKELSPLARQAGDFFLGWTKELRSGGLAARFKAAIQGAIEGLGFKDLPGMLGGIFGNPGEGGAGSVETWKAAAFGFADGIRSVGAVIKGAFSAFAGANASPETIARLTGQIIALAGACVVIAPVVGVIGSIATALGALALAATSAWRVIGGAGIVGGAAAGAGAAGAGASATAGAAAGGIASRLGLAGAGTALMSGIGLAIVAEIGANRGTIATSILTAIKEFVTGLVPLIVTGIKDAVSAIVADVKSKFTLENIKNELTPAPLKRWMDGSAKEQPNQSAPPSAGSPARAYASGGYVSGPGGPRSDSISAFLSNGEFVMNADVVRRIRPWLEDLNAGRIPKDFLHGQSALGDWSGFDKLLTLSGFRGQALSGIRFDPSTALSGSGVFGDGRSQIGELIREIRELIRVLRGERRGGGGRAEEGRATIRERVRISEAARLAEQAGARTRLLALSGGVGPIISGVPAGSGSSVGGGGSGAPRDNSGVGGILNARPGQRLGTGSLGRRGIIGGTGGGGSVPALPGNVPMTPEERNTLGLIMKYESGGQNVMNYVGRSRGLDPTTTKGYTAQGYFQMLNSNWRRIAPKLGITTPNAMASSLEDQTKVALYLLRNGGVKNWANYNPKLRAALARGEQAPAESVPNVGGITGGVGQYDGLRLKGSQATAGGSAHRGVTDLMRAVQGDLPGVVRHFAAVNDRYHAGTGSKHAAGLAFDTSLLDPSKSREAAEAIRNRLRAAGLKEGEFRVINEYLNPSRRSTGGHIHTQFNTAGAAQKYASYLEGLKGPAVAAAEATKDAARAATGAGALSNLPQVGKLVDRMGSDKARELVGQGLLSEGFRKHRLDGALGGRGDLMQNLPFRSSPEDLSGAVRDQVEAKGKAQGATIQGGAGGKSMTVQAPITIQGSTNPEHIANRAAKHIQDSTLWRTHDQDFASV